MSPLNKSKISKVRNKIDKLDKTILNIIKKRTLLVNEVLKLKKYKNEIIYKKRISFILKKIKNKSILNKEYFKYNIQW